MKRHSLHRSRLEACYDVIRSVSEGYDTPTRILRHANLNSETFSVLVNFLSKGGMLDGATSPDGRRKWWLTEKGKLALGTFNSLRVDFDGIMASALADRQT